MAITTTWKIDSLETKIQEQGYTDVVYNIHWRLHANDGDYSTSIYGSQSVSFDPTDPDYVFVPYEELSEATVIGWLKGSIGSEAVTEKETTVANILTGIMNPVVESKPLPWNAAPAPVVEPPVVEAVIEPVVEPAANTETESANTAV